MIKYKLIIISLLITCICCAQPEKKAYIDKVKELYPTADIKSVDFKHDYVEITYKCKDKHMKIGLSMSKQVLFTESETDIPKKIKQKIDDKIEKDFYGWKIDKYDLIVRQDMSFYKVRIINDGVEENEYFTTDGKYYKGKILEFNKNWTIKSLSKCFNYEKAPYHFLNPDKIYKMPKILKELSGITLADKNAIYCIQDEKGTVYKYDLKKAEFTEKLRFKNAGDFEDLAVIDDKIYVLRSDGKIFYFNYKSFDGKINHMVVPANSMNIEGLCYDKTDKKMYMACKGQPISGVATNRQVYSFSPHTMSQPEIALTINMDEIKNWIEENYPTLKNENVQFNPSAIAINPITREKYILSANHRMIAIYKGSVLQNVFPLPSELYYKPEGLAFSENGDLFISSEGVKKDHVEGLIYYFIHK